MVVPSVLTKMKLKNTCSSSVILPEQCGLQVPLQFDVRTLGEGDFLACWKTLREFYDTRGRVEEALQLVDEFNVVNVATTVPAQQPGAPSDSVGVASPGWSSPPPGLVKLNCDGAWVAQTGRGGVGWGAPRWYWMLHQRGGGCGDMRCTSALMAEGRGRKCNQAAHKVAAYAFRIGGRHSWDIVCPEWLFNCLAPDVNCSIRI
ncbi:hypothetical protein L3X38_005208 [Prunus dulcis]|uniref:RNase H type-1 domain-containing protein n=1 Tax=Prunus dulcis TaxID=3755 RepID=A0AAD4ZQI3_PRUDU|nr:hypothetical protein L3X38_005208 [Prunus dulcis]